jgi:hypothetical protein
MKARLRIGARLYSHLLTDCGLRESYLQNLSTAQHHFCLAFVDSSVVVRDTHARHAPDNRKVDHCFVVAKTNSASPFGVVAWNDILVVEELKFDNIDEKDALAQIVDRLEFLARAQPNLTVAGYISNGHTIRFYMRKADGSFLKSNPLTLHGADHVEDDGFLLYLSAITTPPDVRGVRSASPREVIVAPDKKVTFNPIVREASDVQRNKPQVFVSDESDDCKNLVVKLYVDAARRDADLTKMKKVELAVPRSMRSKITVVAAEEHLSMTQLNPALPLLVLQPRACFTLASAVCTATLFVEVCHTLGEVLGAMHDGGYVHGDLSLTNILVLADMAVVLNDFGSVARIGAAAREVPRTQLFASHLLKSDSELYHPISDWLAAFYVLASFGRCTHFAKASASRRLLPFLDATGRIMCSNDVLQDLKAAKFYNPPKAKDFILSLLEEDLRNVRKVLRQSRMTTIHEEEVEGGDEGVAGRAEPMAVDPDPAEEALLADAQALNTALSVLYTFHERLINAIWQEKTDDPALRQCLMSATVW